MLAHIRPAIVTTLFFTLLLGVGYPLLITGVAAMAFPRQAEGSLLRDASGQVIGSRLIAQGFAKAEYLHPRPSAAGTSGYDPTGSSGSNLGPLNPALAQRIATDAATLLKESPAAIPADALTTSGSGLDPDISPANAHRQVARIAAARGLTEAAVDKIIAAHIVPPALGVLGQPTVNVLQTNLALDAAFAKDHRPPA